MNQFCSKSQTKTLKGSSLSSCLSTLKLDPFPIYIPRGERGAARPAWRGRAPSGVASSPSANTRPPGGANGTPSPRGEGGCPSSVARACTFRRGVQQGHLAGLTAPPPRGERGAARPAWRGRAPSGVAASPSSKCKRLQVVHPPPEEG